MKFIGWTTPGCGAKCPKEAWFLEPGGTTPRMDSMEWQNCKINLLIGLSQIVSDNKLSNLPFFSNL
ncbi:hypothetical protein KFK09_010610 [Dendrobium nobile]|uniref:Uncharacterized protein n=1 Tax=Dendrobium nobile TaxID=94219 RepID=A0A8T3BCK6_DENNO|nr:hypothetical protein KFK09_010610 [Dendrobium nobile]